MRLLRALALTLGTVAAAALIVVVAVRTFVWIPQDVETVAPSCEASAPELACGQRFKVLVWNVQYAGSRKHNFFYDGGRAAHVPEADVRATLARIGEVIRDADADLVLLQEVDRDSARTHRIDQHEALLGAVPYPCHLSTPYHKLRYLPHPSHEPLGRVDLHLSVFSRYQIRSATRYQLALMDEPAWRQLLNLRRALLEVRLPVQGGGELIAFNTHLSAFSRGDGTLAKQAQRLEEAMTAAELAGMPWLLGGDLNMLPPGDDPRRLGDEAGNYAESVSPVKALMDRHGSVIPEAQYRAEPERFRTYLPFGAAEPNRTLDYVFAGRKVLVHEVQVLPITDVSDHMPLLVELEIE